MSIFYTIVFLPLVLWLVLICVGVIFRLLYSKTIAGVVLVFCVASIAFPGLILLGFVAVVCFGLSMLLRHLSGVR